MSLPPIDVVELFPEERASLLGLLRTLEPAEWQSPTVCTGWSVADVARHILWTDVSYLSRHRDDYFGPPDEAQPDLSDWAALVAFINGLNDNWIRGTRRMSPNITTSLLQAMGEEMADFQRQRSLQSEGVPVDWAGEGPAPVWMDVAREYTERWVHQQHIRDAVGKPGLTDRRHFFPVLDAFARALPHSLRTEDATVGSIVQLTITGEAGGVWTAVREVSSWSLQSESGTDPIASVTIDQDVAWRLFTKGVDADEIGSHAIVEGDPKIASKIVHMVSIIA